VGEECAATCAVVMVLNLIPIQGPSPPTEWGEREGTRA